MSDSKDEVISRRASLEILRKGLLSYSGITDQNMREIHLAYQRARQGVTVAISIIEAEEAYIKRLESLNDKLIRMLGNVEL